MPGVRRYGGLRRSRSRRPTSVARARSAMRSKSMSAFRNALRRKLTRKRRSASVRPILRMMRSRTRIAPRRRGARAIGFRRSAMYGRR